MTTTHRSTDERLHDLAVLTVDDLTFDVAPPADRTTLEIVVERDARLTLKAPEAVTVERARRFVASKRSWIYRKLAEKDALVGPPVAKRFVDGEGFAYLGRSHRLLVTDDGSEVKLQRGRFHLPRHLVPGGATVMRRWYIDTGAWWLAQRLSPWAARLGLDDRGFNFDLDVRDLGYRWGSARPPGPEAGLGDVGRVNIHWATVQLPTSLIDYVLVHELAHLVEPGHGPDFWTIVGRVMPDYETQRSNLAAIGKNVWLGAVQSPAPRPD